jgi:hypothetical protein
MLPVFAITGISRESFVTGSAMHRAGAPQKTVAPGRAVDPCDRNVSHWREIGAIALLAGIAILNGIPLLRLLVVDRPHVNLA